MVTLIEIVKLLVRHGAKHYDVDIHGESPLHRAAKYDHLETVQYLLARGANVDEVDANGQTALHKAADYGHLDVVKYLARRGSRPDKRDEYGYINTRALELRRIMERGYTRETLMDDFCIKDIAQWRRQLKWEGSISSGTSSPRAMSTLRMSTSVERRPSSR